MPLTYGFRDQSSEATKKYWDEKYQALSEEQKQFFHSTLGMCLVVWAVSHISKTTIEEIIEREMTGLAPMFTRPKNTNDDEYREQIEEMLTPFIGFEANVHTETFKEWVNIKVQHKYRRSKLKSRAAITKEQTQYEKWKKTVEK